MGLIHNKRDNEYVSEYNLEKQCKKIGINALFTICELGEKYKEFYDDLDSLIDAYPKKDVVNEVYNAIIGRTFIKSFRYKNFIDKHSETIEVMKNYNCLWMINLYRPRNNSEKVNAVEDYFYNLIFDDNCQNNKSDQVKALAIKLKSLGFDEIYYNEDLDFSLYGYRLEVRGSSYSKINYVDNVKIIAGYEIDTISYETNSSNFLLHLEYGRYSIDKKFDKFSSRVFLNNLFFSAEKLPDTSDYDDVRKIIVEKSKEKNSEYKAIRDVVDLSISLGDFKDLYDELLKIAEGVEAAETKVDLLNMLDRLGTLIGEVEGKIDDYSDEVMTEQEIAPETIEKEKKLYIERRYFSKLDLD